MTQPEDTEEPLDRRALDVRFKEKVMKKIADLERGHEGMRTEIHGIKTSLDTNTTITLLTKAAIEQHSARTAPLVEGWEAMQYGIAIIGKIGRAGSATGRFAVRMIRPLLYVGAAAIFAKSLMHGDGWQTALEAFTKAMGPK